MSAISIVTHFGALATIASGIVASAAAQAAPSSEPGTRTRVYISTFTEHGGDGIYLAELNPSTGDLGTIRLVGDVRKASFLALHPNHRYLYSTCEVDNYHDAKGGAVAAFKIDSATGNLTLLNHQSSSAEGPHYLSLDREGKNALVANYHGGGVAVLPIRADGTLRSATSRVLHHGSSVNKSRQTGAHPHAIEVDPTNQLVFVPDLGLDKVIAYRFNAAAGTIVASHSHDLATSPGAGPRHITFHSNGKWAYVINELDSTVIGLRYESQTGALTQINIVSTLPAGATQKDNLTGEIVVHPNGKFLYASNRGHDSIAVFAIDQASGQLSSLGHCLAGGRTPRNFNIDPSGKYLLSANLGSDSVTVLPIDPITGKLSRAAHEIKVIQPYCIQFFSPGD
jgi:6-phosphogluconolactonase